MRLRWMDRNRQDQGVCGMRVPGKSVRTIKKGFWIDKYLECVIFGNDFCCLYSTL
jgi:hypothetical protein